MIYEDKSDSALNKTRLQNALYRYHSITETFTHICNNQTPWVAIGNFLNDWWFFAADQRHELIATPLSHASTLEMQRWAAFCAAMVEWLCKQEDIAIPEWTQQACYVLVEPWFLYAKPSYRSWLLATTPAPFKMRNIFGGDRMFNHVPRNTYPSKGSKENTSV